MSADPEAAMSGSARRWLASLGRWEVLLAIVLVVLVVFGSTVSPVFLSGRNFANLISAVIEVAIMSLPMALIIIAGEIDLSVESMLGLSVSVLGYLYAAGVPIEVAIPIVLVIGALGGPLNGVLVTRAGCRRSRHRLARRAHAGSPSWCWSRAASASSRRIDVRRYGPRLPIPWPFVVPGVGARARGATPRHVDRP
jgi:hypothetical protein